jgi:hypothetical protein
MPGIFTEINSNFVLFLPSKRFYFPSFPHW